MRRLILVSGLLLLAGLVFAQASADSINAPLPFLMNPFFDSYSHNYLGAAAMGRGNTGIAAFGGVESVLANPATFYPEKTELALEFVAKPAIDAKDYPFEAQFGTSNPLGVAGFGAPLSEKLSYALLYSQPKSIVLDSYSIMMHGGAYVLNRRPVYYQHQFTANLGYHLDRLHLGASLHNQIHYMDDIPFLRTFDRVKISKYIPRLQAGALYVGNSGDIGMSVTLPSNADFDLPYKDYDSLLPLKLAIGTTFRENARTWHLEADYEQYSAVHASFDDRLRLKAGMEFLAGSTTYRLGYMYSPEVFSGKYIIPLNTTASQDTSNVWNAVASYHTVETNTQHFLSAGIGYEHRLGSINFAYMQSLNLKAPLAQVSLGISFYLDALIKRDKDNGNDEEFSQYP